jgi:uncharacterized membrane protein YeiH
VKIHLVTTILDLLGVGANAILGGAIARSREMDLVGFLALGLVSGLGGGIIRDVLIGHGPPAALTNPAYIPIALGGAALAFLVRIDHRWWDRIYMTLDSAGLTVWAIAGAQKALAAGLGWMPAILLGTITAVGGGVVRGILLQRTPAVFGRSPLYASVAVIVSGIAVFFQDVLHAHIVLGTVVAIIVGTGLRIAAAVRGWTLPTGLEWEPRDAVTKLASRIPRRPPPSGPPPEGQR